MLRRITDKVVSLWPDPRHTETKEKEVLPGMNRYSIEARDDGRYQVRTPAAIEGAAGTVVVISYIRMWKPSIG